MMACLNRLSVILAGPCALLALHLSALAISACVAQPQSASLQRYIRPSACLGEHNPAACVQCDQLLSHLFETHLYAAGSDTASGEASDRLVADATCIATVAAILHDAPRISERELNDRWIRETETFVRTAEDSSRWPKTAAACFDLSRLPFRAELLKQLDQIEQTYDLQCKEIENSVGLDSSEVRK